MQRDDVLTDLMARAAEGDDTAVAQFVRVTQADVWRLCQALGSAGEVEDLVQETYVRAIGAIPSFRGDASARSWLLRIARNVCADHVRHRQRVRGLLERLAPAVRHSVHDEPDFTASVVAALPRARREAFVLTQILDLSYEEAAKVLDCPVGTIRSRVFRARTQLSRQYGAADIA